MMFYISIGILIIAITMFFVDYLVGSSFGKCKHEHWAQYQSRSQRVCIDCGKIEKVDKWH